MTSSRVGYGLEMLAKFSLVKRSFKRDFNQNKRNSVRPPDIEQTIMAAIRSHEKPMEGGTVGVREGDRLWNGEGMQELTAGHPLQAFITST